MKEDDDRELLDITDHMRDLYEDLHIDAHTWMPLHRWWHRLGYDRERVGELMERGLFQSAVIIHQDLCNLRP